MPSEITVRLIPKTEDLAAALEVIGRHAQACAEELRALRLTLPPTMRYDAAAIAEAARDEVGGG
jgi:hypothetical protein